MATSLSTARVSGGFSANFASTVDLGTVTHDVVWGPSYVFTDGTGADQAKAVFTDTRTIAASSSESLDLDGLTDAFGNTIVGTKIKAIAIQAASGNTNDVVVGGAASNQFASLFGDVSDTIKIKPGGFFMAVAPNSTGYAITASTGDTLKIANSSSGSGVTYTIAILFVV